jgi:hypothetical protein
MIEEARNELSAASRLLTEVEADAQARVADVEEASERRVEALMLRVAELRELSDRGSIDELVRERDAARDDCVEMRRALEESGEALSSLRARVSLEASHHRSELASVTRELSSEAQNLRDQLNSSASRHAADQARLTEELEAVRGELQEQAQENEALCVEMADLTEQVGVYIQSESSDQSHRRLPEIPHRGGRGV